MSSLQASGISFRYPQGERDILSGFDIAIESGQRVGIAAPSGFGKTTLCKILAGYEKPQGGTVLLDGEPLASYKGYSPVQMIWQHPEQVINPRRRMGYTLHEGGQVEQHILDALGIEAGWLERFPAELSGGELQRFCVARALGKETKFILADEISTMLDLITQAQLWDFIVGEAIKRGLGLLAVSHSRPLLEKVCSHIIDLDQ